MHTPLRHLRHFTVFALLLALPACSHSLSSQDRAALRKVAVTKTGPAPKRDQVIILTLGKNWAMAASYGVGGLVGVGIAACAYKSREEQFLAQLQAAGFDPYRAVGDAFEMRLRASSPIQVGPDRPDAVFSFELTSIGLAIKNGFSSQMRPILIGKGKLVRRGDGKVLWEETAQVTNGEDRMPAHRIEEYTSNPALLRDAFQQAADLLSKRLVADLLDRDLEE